MPDSYNWIDAFDETMFKWLALILSISVPSAEKWWQDLAS